MNGQNKRTLSELSEKARNRMEHAASTILPGAFSVVVLIAISGAASGPVSAGTVRERARATVAVARAQVQLANSRPLLPNSRERFGNFNPRETHEAILGTDATRVVPMKIMFPKVAPVSEVKPAQLVIEVWESGCPHCMRQERDIIRVLGQLGWAIGNSTTDQIQFVIIPQTMVAPQCVLYQNGIEVKRWEGYQDPAMLSNALRKAWDESPAPNLQISAMGVAGAIQGKSQIRTILNWLEANVGEGVKAEIRWDRSGAQSFPLLAKGDWSAVALFGKFGHFKLSAADSANLPLESIGFTYTVDGDDITFDVDAITMQGLALRFGPSSQIPRSLEPAGTAPVPCQIGLVSVWTVLSVVRDIWQLLHPTCDLQLGGNVSATAVLTGDTLAIDFQQMPSIRLVALFTFQLGIRRVEITESNVHVDFSGSRLVKSRDFPVQ